MWCNGAMILRDFLYLNRSMVRTFLAQLEGGVVDEATERQTASGKGGFGGKIGAGPAALSAEKSKENSVQTEAVVKQVAASEFQRLYDLLEGDDLVILDEVSDPGVVGELKRKQVLELDGRVRVSGVQQLMEPRAWESL